jgi:sugar phosphate isomerase/epimerase
VRLGFVSAIFPELSLEEVLALAADEGFDCVELMCWPPGKADRRYAGVTHLDVTQFDAQQANYIHELTRIHGVSIASLGYYPNPLDADPAHREAVVTHLMKVIEAAPKIGVSVVNTFLGRNHREGIAANWELADQVWPPIFAAARAAGVSIGIEHCPMLFSSDEWPGGKNLPVSPALWRELFTRYPDAPVGLNFDPSHLVWQFIDCGRAVREFGSRIVHVHAKDERIDHEKLHQVGILGLGWHQPKLPGLGDVPWGEFFAALTDSGYDGSICIEVEDRAYERHFEDRKRSIRQSRRFLQQYLG